MAQLTITTSVSVTSLDGLTSSVPSSAHVISCNDYVEFTRDVTVTGVRVFTGTWSALVVANAGDVDLIVEIGVSSDFHTQVVPAGAGAVLPSTFETLAGVVVLGTGIRLYTASGTTRAVVAIGINNI